MVLSLYSPLGQFLGGYFHEDWMLDDATWQDAVRRFKREARQGDARLVAEQLKALLASGVDENGLRSQLRDCAVAFSPGAVGLSTIQWLDEVVILLEESAA